MYIPLFAGLHLTSCVEQADKFKEESISIDVDEFGNPIPRRQEGKRTEAVSEQNSISGAHIKNFNQINMSFSKLTGVSRSHDNVQDVMGQILNQLPSSNDLGGFTPFHQISITRLAFTYCELFIDNDATFSNIDYERLSSVSMADAMITHFLDEVPEDEPAKYDVLRGEMISILDNEDLDQVGPLVNSNGVGNATLMRRLSKMACSLTLSSSFVTLI